MRPAWLAMLCAIGPASALADIVSPAPDSVRVTLYRDPSSAIDYDIAAGDVTTGLAMVTETRTIDLPVGTSKLVFRGVADAIVPQTASVEGLPVAIVESNFDYDLLTPGAVMAKSVGQRVRHVRTDTGTGRTISREATIVSAPDGVLLNVDGNLEALGCSGLDEKLVFERVPPGLADEPALSMTVRAHAPGRHTITLNYLALGLDWSANYVATLNPDGRSLNLVGWLTLVNRASTTFANAPTQVVAGRLERNYEETQPPQATVIEQKPACWPIGSFATRVLPRPRGYAGDLHQSFNAPAFAADQVLQETVVTGSRVQLAAMSELGDYKLYTLPGPTTVAARQSKQVQFLRQQNVRFDRLYSFRLRADRLLEEDDHQPHRPTVVLKLENEKKRGLGKPLPGGSVAVFEPVEGRSAVLAGEDAVEDTPVGLPLELELGAAMDVWIEPRIVEDETVDDDRDEDEDSDGENERRVQVEVKLGNDKPTPVVIEFRQPADAEGFRILSESRRHTTKHGDVMWTFKLRPGARASLRYSFRQDEDFF